MAGNNQYNLSNSLLSKIRRFNQYMPSWSSNRDFYINKFLPDLIAGHYNGLDQAGRVLFLEIRQETTAKQWRNLIQIFINENDNSSSYTPSAKPSANYSYNKSTTKKSGNKSAAKKSHNTTINNNNSYKTTTNTNNNVPSPKINKNQQKQPVRQSHRSYLDKYGNSILLDKEIGRGGEGAVFNIKGKSDVVAKLYFPKVLEKHNKTKKINAMCALYEADLAKTSALPQKAIFDPFGNVVGFIMEKVTGYEAIHNLYGISTKRKIFSKADWGFMVHAAKNLACAVDKLHSKNIVIGDINQGNIFVDKRAMIKLMDCDSYQIQYDGEYYLCEVGVAEYTPPELQDTSFDKIQRTKNHDCFGLAVMIFKILMFGRHPYSGNGAPADINDLVRNGRYCYHRNINKITPIHSELTSELFSDEIKTLFERAFSQNSYRPTAQEWIRALDNLEKNLATCPYGHKYFKNAKKSCVWCKIAQKNRYNPFDKPIDNKNNYQKQTPSSQTNNKYAQKKSPNPAKTAYKQQSQQRRIQNRQNFKYQQQQQQQTQQYPSYTKLYTSNGIDWNWKAILGIFIVLFIIIGALNSDDSSKTNTQNTQKIQTQQVQKINYTDTQRIKDLRTYKDELINKIRQNYHPENDTEKYGDIRFWVKINKDGSINEDNITDEIKYHHSEARMAMLRVFWHDYHDAIFYDPLPNSYAPDSLTLKFVFTKNGVYYEEEQPKNSVINAEKKNENIIKNTNTVRQQSENQQKSAVVTKPKANTNIPPKPKPVVKTDLEKSTDYFFE